MGDMIVDCEYSEFEGSSITSSLLKHVLRNDYLRRVSLEMEESLKGVGEEGKYTDSRSIPREVCEAVLLKLHQDLRELLNFEEIWPFLNKRELLDSKSQAFFVNAANNPQRKVDILLAKLIEYPSEDFLTPFIESLAESHDHVAGIGTGHQDLINEILRLLKAELKKRKDKTLPRKLNSWLILVIIPSLAVLTVLYFALLGIFSHTLVLPHSERSVEVMPGTGFIVNIDNVIRNDWTSSVDVHWNKTKNFNCRGNISILQGVNCSNSLLLERSYSKHIPHSPTLPTYLLPDSSINVTIKYIDKPENVIVKLSTSLHEYFRIFQNQRNPPDPSDPCNPPYCYDAVKLPHNFKISEAGFYYVYVLDDGLITSPSSVGIDYSINAVMYSNNSVLQYSKSHSSEIVSIGDDDDDFKPITVKVSENFHFGKSFCNLLWYSCRESGEDPFSLIIENDKPRTDIIIITTIVFAPFICALVIVIIILSIKVYRMKLNKLNRK